MDRHSNIIFNANLIYDTSKNSKPFNSKVRITLSGYGVQGEVSIEETSIDSYLFPVLLKVEYQKFEFIEYQYLLVKGFHSQNPNIGNYTVKIYPII